MELIGTPRSHFTRKIRLLLDHYGTDYALNDVGDVSQAQTFADNPLMSVPVLRCERLTVIDSDHIAAFCVRQLDPEDQYNVLTSDPQVLNARVVLNGIMSAEVRLILAERTGLETEGADFFDKARHVITNGLDWCEANAGLFNPEALTYLTFHFISAWDHIRLYDVVSGDWPNLRALAAKLNEQPLIRQSKPD